MEAPQGVQGSVFDARPSAAAEEATAAVAAEPKMKADGAVTVRDSVPEPVRRLEAPPPPPPDTGSTTSAAGDKTALKLAPVRFHIRVPNLGLAMVTAHDGLRVAPTAHLIGEIERLLGRGTVALG